jgi:hypothetical protein
MKFQTQIPFKKQSNNLMDYESNILLLGSCFAENIGDKLEYYKFRNAINPFGILFHPNAIEALIANAVNEKVYTDNDVFFHEERWHCFDAHSVLSNDSKEDLLVALNKKLKITKRQIQESTHVIITFGTAWVYYLLESKKIVANCHKLPQKQFQKKILSVDEIVTCIENIETLIRSKNPEIQIIYTVSPVRHIKDGFIENQRSKSHLITAIHEVLNHNSQNRNKKSIYFPSYEILMDELRDYRFYAEDMIHPNQTAINYIWNKFQLVFMSLEVSIIMDEVHTIQKGLRHKPFNSNSISHKQFLKTLGDKKLKLQSKFSHITF